VTFDRGRGRLTVEAASAGGERLNFLDLRARVIRPDLKIEEVALRQTAIGVYEAEFEADRAGAYLAGVVGDGGRQATVGGMVAFSPEYRDFEANTHLLSEIARQTGGRMEPRLEEIFRREGPPVRAAREVTAALLALAIALLLIEVAARRLYFDPEQMAAARALMARVNPWRLVFAGAGGGERGVTEALRVRSERIRQRLHRVSEPARGGEGAQGTDGTDGTDQPKSSDAGEGAASGAFASDGAASTVQSTSSTPFTESTPGASKPSLARLKKPRPTDGDLTPDAQRLREKLGPNKPNWSESSSPSAPRPTRSREPEKTTSRLIDARRKRKGDDPKDSPSTPDPDPPSPS
jgi:hypothetical protein